MAEVGEDFPSDSATYHKYLVQSSQVFDWLSSRGGYSRIVRRSTDRKVKILEEIVRAHRDRNFKPRHENVGKRAMPLASLQGQGQGQGSVNVPPEESPVISATG